LIFKRGGFRFGVLNGITPNESMNESSDELTPKENFAASNYKNSEATFKRALIRRLSFIIPSIVLMIVWLITKDPAYAYMGYGLLLYQAVNSIFLAKRGLQTANKVITKYEKKIQDKQGAA
jgi:hypothetical protein